MKDKSNKKGIITTNPKGWKMPKNQKRKVQKMFKELDVLFSEGFEIPPAAPRQEP